MTIPLSFAAKAAQLIIMGFSTIQALLSAGWLAVNMGLFATSFKANLDLRLNWPQIFFPPCPSWMDHDRGADRYPRENGFNCLV